MTIEWTNYSSPVYISADGQLIDCILTVTGLGDIPFTASANDVAPHGRAIFAAIIANVVTSPVATFDAQATASMGPPPRGRTRRKP